jgi:hypothetical protein
MRQYEISKAMRLISNHFISLQFVQSLNLYLYENYNYRGIDTDSKSVKGFLIPYQQYK